MPVNASTRPRSRMVVLGMAAAVVAAGLLAISGSVHRARAADGPPDCFGASCLTLVYAEALKGTYDDTVFIPGSDNMASRPTYSADGQWIYYITPHIYDFGPLNQTDNPTQDPPHPPGGNWPNFFVRGSGTPWTGCDYDGVQSATPPINNPSCIVAKNQIHRVKVDGTGDVCLSCALVATGTEAGRPLMANFPQQRPQGDYVVFLREREYHDYSMSQGVCGSGDPIFWDVAVWPTSAEPSVSNSSVTRFAGPGLTQLEPRWSDDGTKILWAEYEGPCTVPTECSMGADWDMRIGHFVPGTPPLLEGVVYDGAQGTIVTRGAGTTPYDAASTKWDPDDNPLPSGGGQQKEVYITGGFRRGANEKLAGIYYATAPVLDTSPTLKHQTQHTDDHASMAFATPNTQTRLTTSSGLDIGGGLEARYYEEFNQFNNKFQDVFAYMTSNPYEAPSDGTPCFMSDEADGTPGLRTELYLMNSDGNAKTRISYFNDSVQDWQGLNPEHYRIITSELAWAPNGTDVVSTIAADVNTSPTATSLWSDPVIFHFKRWQNPTWNQNNMPTDNGLETCADEAYRDGAFLSSAPCDDGYARNTTAGHKHHFAAFNFGFPTVPMTGRSVVIDGIEVRVDAKATGGSGGTPRIKPELWDGTAWKTNPTKSTVNLTSTEQSFYWGSASDKWGSTWDTTKVDNSHLNLRLTMDCSSSCTGRTWWVDWATVKVSWHVENTLDVTVSGPGTVTSSPAGINCPGDCTNVYHQSTSVTLTATPNAGKVFDGWSGPGCSGTASTCVVKMGQVKAVTATFH